MYSSAFTLCWGWSVTPALNKTPNPKDRRGKKPGFSVGAHPVVGLVRGIKEGPLRKTSASFSEMNQKLRRALWLCSSLLMPWCDSEGTCFDRTRSITAGNKSVWKKNVDLACIEHPTAPYTYNCSLPVIHYSVILLIEHYSCSAVTSTLRFCFPVNVALHFPFQKWSLRITGSLHWSPCWLKSKPAGIVKWGHGNSGNLHLSISVLNLLFPGCLLAGLREWNLGFAPGKIRLWGFFFSQQGKSDWSCCWSAGQKVQIQDSQSLIQTNVPEEKKMSD